MSRDRRTHLSLDSNVLTGGIVSRWALDKAVLALCAARICCLVLAEAVREEVEENLLIHAATLERTVANQLLKDYDRLLRLTRPLIIPYPPESEVIAARPLIRHADAEQAGLAADPQHEILFAGGGTAQQVEDRHAGGFLPGPAQGNK